MCFHSASSRRNLTESAGGFAARCNPEQVLCRSELRTGHTWAQFERQTANFNAAAKVDTQDPAGLKRLQPETLTH